MLLVRGCLIPLAIFGIAYFLEKRYFDANQLPFPAAAAGILAFILTIAIGGILEMPNTYRKWAGPPPDLSAWQDGQIVQLSGRLKPAGQPLKAPFSRRPAVGYQYYAYVPAPHNANDDIPSARMRGNALGPCELGWNGGSIRVEGIAPLDAFPQDKFAGESIAAAVKEHVAKTQWTVPSVFSAETWSATNIWTEEAKRLLVSSSSLGNWRYEERIIPPFAEVALVGTYRADPPRIDIQAGVMKAEHEIRPGKIGAGATVSFVLSVFFQIAAMAASAWALWAIHSDGGARYKAWIQGLEAWLPK